MPALTHLPSPRLPWLAAIVVPLLLAVAAIPIYRWAGVGAAIALVTAGNILLAVALLSSAERRTRRAADDAPVHEAPLRAEPGTDAGSRPNNAFLPWLSHELRSPLNACVMWLDVLALAPQADKLAQAVDAIKRNLARQTRLVSDLSDAAKIQSNGLEVQLEPLDLVAFLKDHVDAWQLLAIGKQLTFEHRVEPVAAPVDADAARLLQMLNHLIENAVASTPAGGRIELRARLDGEECILQIEDGGAGLSFDDAAHLGRPLWRAAGTSKSRPGFGLGLAVAHHLAAKHGGNLRAASRSSGALFTLSLPLATGARPPP